MDIFRNIIDSSYPLIKPFLFRKDPQQAHEMFSQWCLFLYRKNIDKLLFYHRKNTLPFPISNAAGFNKNGSIPPRVLKYLGFSRVVVGTVMNNPWKGNPGVTIQRYPGTESMVNWMGLPGVGAEQVAKNLQQFGKRGVPLTINFMSTPQKQGHDVLDDLKGTILATRDIPSVDRFELNISCPNTHGSSGTLDARRENLSQLQKMLHVVEQHVHPSQEIYLKISPDSTEDDVNDIINVVQKYRVNGFVIGNTSTNHDPKFISLSPGKGGASGNAVYYDSLRTQKMFYERLKKVDQKYTIIACGGINSSEKVKERFSFGATEIQIFTPLIFSGPGLLREMRKI